MAVVINGKAIPSFGNYREHVLAGNSKIAEIELKIPDIDDFTFSAWPEYDLYVCFGNSPFGETLEILTDWVYAYRFETSIPNTVYVFNANGSDGTVELKQNDWHNAYIKGQSFTEERITYDRHSTYTYQDEVRSINLLSRLMAGEELTPSSTFTAFLNGSHDYTFIQQGTDIVLARYSGGVLTDVHDRMKIPPLIYSDQRSSTAHGRPMGDRVHLYTMKPYQYWYSEQEQNG